MSPSGLDEVDRGILHELQKDARNNVASAIAEAVDVSPNTVRNRIERLEEDGIVQGYHPHIDYEQAGFQLRVVFVCTVPISDRQEMADEALGVEGVVEVTQIISGQENLWIEVVGTNGDEITSIAERIERIGVEIRDERFVKNVRARPFDHFGADVVEE